MTPREFPGGLTPLSVRPQNAFLRCILQVPASYKMLLEANHLILLHPQVEDASEALKIQD